jgi:hypothetical protein
MFEFTDTAPIKGIGVGVNSGVGVDMGFTVIFPTSTCGVDLEKIETNNKPLNKPAISETNAVEIARTRRFTLAQPTGQSLVITLPSMRRYILTHTRPSELVIRLSASSSVIPDKL